MSVIVEQDLNYIFQRLTPKEKGSLKNSTLLITGCAGFLGFYFLRFFHRYRSELGIDQIIGLDNFQTGYPPWLKSLEEAGAVKLHKFNIISDNLSQIPGAEKATHILHMASIASPIFYRKYPIETLDANIWGLRRLLDFYMNRPIRGLVFFSSSEIYGDPSPDNIPTPEDYRGNVSCLGPRACYDEAKRFGETMCYLFNEKYRMPITIIRPFNNYGPGMRLNDSRVPADFAKAVLENRDIVMFSDGSPTRTFCYIADAITGYLKVLLYSRFDAFNIGMDRPEISIKRLAEIYQAAGSEVLGYTGDVSFETSCDKDYLTNNPNRRCPDLTKARTLLGYNPAIEAEEGVCRFLRFIHETDRGELEW